MAFEGIEQFDEIVDRRGTNSYKWEDIPDVGVRKEDVLPLWVADMDFRTAPVVRRAIEARAKHGVFGYSYVPEAYYDAVRNWFGRQGRDSHLSESGAGKEIYPFRGRNDEVLR